MNISKKQLKKIITEEIQKVLQDEQWVVEASMAPSWTPIDVQDFYAEAVKVMKTGALSEDYEGVLEDLIQRIDDWKRWLIEKTNINARQRLKVIKKSLFYMFSLMKPDLQKRGKVGEKVLLDIYKLVSRFYGLP